MSKRHIIINVGNAGNVMSKAAPDAYSIEATGYDMDEVHELFETVHNHVRPTDDEDLEPVERIGGPIPFSLSGFSLVRKLPDATEPAAPTSGQARARDFLADLFGGDMPAAFATHDGEPGELERCGCDTDTPPFGTLLVRIDGVNHRFRTFPRARAFALAYKLTPEAVFAHPLEDENLCCFPYAFELLVDGTFMGFQTHALAVEVASLYGYTDEDITYHSDEHRPEHRARYEEARKAEDAARAALRNGTRDLCTDDACRFHGSVPEHWHAVGDPEHRHGAISLEQPTEPDGQPSDTTWENVRGLDTEKLVAETERAEQRAADRADATEYMLGGIVSGSIPAQRDDDIPVASKPRLPRRTRTISEHPDPCLPGCTCGNGPTPLADDDTDG